MTTMQKIGYGIGGFSLCMVTAVIAATGMQWLFNQVWSPSSGFLATYGSAIAIVITAVASTWVYLLQSLKNEAMIRGVWCHIYTIVALAAVSLVLSIWM